MKIKFSNYLLVAVLQATLAVYMGINIKKNIRKIKKYIQFRIFVVKYTSDTK